MSVFSHLLRIPRQRIPFHVVARLLRAAFGVDNELADHRGPRTRADSVTGAQPTTSCLLEDLLGIRDPEFAAPHRSRCSPSPAHRLDERRRWLASTPAVYVIEDVHWIDEVSESMLTEFRPVIPQTRPWS